MLIGSLSAAVIAAVVSAYPARTQTARPTPDTVESHLAAGKNAAGGRDDTPDFYGLVTAICVAPLNGAARPDAPALGAYGRAGSKALRESDVNWRRHITTTTPAVVITSGSAPKNHPR